MVGTLHTLAALLPCPRATPRHTLPCLQVQEEARRTPPALAGGGAVTLRTGGVAGLAGGGEGGGEVPRRTGDNTLTPRVSLRLVLSVGLGWMSLNTIELFTIKLYTDRTPQVGL